MCFMMSNTNSSGKSNGLGSVIYFPRRNFHFPFLLLVLYLLFLNVVMCRMVRLLFITRTTSVEHRIIRMYHGYAMLYTVTCYLFFSFVFRFRHHKYKWLYLFVDVSDQITGRRDQFCHLSLLRENVDCVLRFISISLARCDGNQKQNVGIIEMVSDGKAPSL